MQKGIIGKKLGMTQLFDENGKVVPVTVIEAGPCTVVQKKTVESDGYQAVTAKFPPRRSIRPLRATSTRPKLLPRRPCVSSAWTISPL